MTAGPVITVSCRCGNVAFSAAGKPIVGAVCYCDDCQEAANRIEALADAQPVLSADGGTAYFLYRRDRFVCLTGGQSLTDIRIRGNSPTRRVIAGCCNSAMFLDFEKGHWVSAYSARFGGDAPPLEMRIQTRFKPAGVVLPRDLPIYAAFPPVFMVRLILARIAMLFRS